MIELIRRPGIGAAIVLIALGFLAGGIALRPALAGGSGVAARPFAVVTCSKIAACQQYKNTNIGPALEGDNTNTVNFSAKAGLLGTSTGAAAGVEGLNTTTAGNDNSTGGVVALSTGNQSAVNASATGTGSGVIALAASGAGIAAQSQNSLGVAATSINYIALYAQAFATAAPGFEMEGGSPAIQAQTNAPSVIFSGNASPSGLGILSETPPGGNAYPFVARDQNSNNLFYVDGTGSVFYKGTLTHFASTRDGNVAETYTSTATSPTVEDNGTARLVDGEATVALDPVFAQSIDLHHAYQVMLTPDGDTRGLYTADKTPTSFTVRELQGGRGTLDFDYHIYASSLGEGGVRAREMTPAQAVARQPRPIRLAPRPNLALPHP